MSGKKLNNKFRFTKTKKKKFCDVLRETGNVTKSAEAVGKTRACVYTHRKNDPEFAMAWREAYETAIDTLEEEARRRAFEGVEDPVYYNGEICGYRQKYSDTLLIFMLKGNREKYRDHHVIEGNTDKPLQVNLTFVEPINDAQSNKS